MAKAAGVVALAGPLLIGVLAVVVSQRPSDAAIALWAASILVVIASDVVTIAKRRWALAAAALSFDALVVLFLTTYCASPLPRPATLSGLLPEASPPEGMALYRLPTGINHHAAAFGYRGGSFLERRDFTMSAALVRHPRGDLLIDTGFSRAIASQLRLMPSSFRLLTNYELGRSAAEQLDAAGYDRKKLSAILLTHAHWDHTSGLQDFPNVPILVTAGERRFIEDGGWLTVIARGVPGASYRVYDFEGGPYLGFPASHDLYGDGSIVVVPAPGHTPGSVIVFVALPNKSRYAFVGDLVWQLEGITEREMRPWLVGRLGRENPDEVRENILRMAAIVERFPEITIVPAHDSSGFASIPVLPSSGIGDHAAM
jgi:glyoxylase-like metal-dependent hydrolase (beta-lactamase superfamily II)